MHTGREQGGRERGETRVWLRADSMWGSPERSSHRVLRRTGGAVAQEGEVSTNGETSSAIGTRAKHKTRPPKIQTFCHAGSAQGPSRWYPGMACFPLEVFRCREQTLGGILSLKMAQPSQGPRASLRGNQTVVITVADGLGSRAPREPAEGFSCHPHFAVAEKAHGSGGRQLGFPQPAPFVTVSVS